MNDNALLEEMFDANEEHFVYDCSVDEDSREQYNFHFVASYLNCYVVAGKTDEMKYDRIMDYVCSKLDLFTEDYGIE